MNKSVDCDRCNDSIGKEEVAADIQADISENKRVSQIWCGPCAVEVFDP